MEGFRRKGVNNGGMKSIQEDLDGLKAEFGGGGKKS